MLILKPCLIFAPPTEKEKNRQLWRRLFQELNFTAIRDQWYILLELLMVLSLKILIEIRTFLEPCVSKPHLVQWKAVLLLFGECGGSTQTAPLLINNVI